MPFHTTLIAAAILRRDDAVLLVHQQGPDDAHPNWALPGGVVEAGESLPDALIREVREETGLTVTRLGPLAYVTQIMRPHEDAQTLAFVFEADWTGELMRDDPDGLVQDAAFLALDAAVDGLNAIPWPSMGHPGVAYLTGRTPPGALWLYTVDATGNDTLVSCITVT